MNQPVAVMDDDSKSLKVFREDKELLPNHSRYVPGEVLVVRILQNHNGDLIPLSSSEQYIIETKRGYTTVNSKMIQYK